jgi:ADP-heptose:LPS heptosyltransferase
MGKIRRVASSSIRGVRTALTFLADGAFCASRGGSGNSDGKTIAIVRLDAIGDFVLWQGYASYIRDHFPDHHIILLANAVWADLARTLPYWDEVIAVDVNRFANNWSYRFQIASVIRTARASLTINPTFSRSFGRSDALVRLIGSPQRVGLRGDTSNLTALEKAVSDGYYTRLVELDRSSGSELAVNAAFASAIVQRSLPIAPPSLPIPKVSSRAISEDYAVLFPGASWDGRRWPLENFAEIGQKLRAEYGLGLVICGGGSEIELAARLQKLLGPETNNLSGATSLPALVSLISHATVVITNETSAAHIAAAVRTAAVCVLGGGHLQRFLPYPQAASSTTLRSVYLELDCTGCNWNCIYPTAPDQAKPCIANIDVRSVWRAVQEQLQVRTELLRVAAAPLRSQTDEA